MLIALDILEFIQRRNIMIYKICLKSLLVLFILTVFVSFSCSVKNNESGAGESEENTAEETIDEKNAIIEVGNLGYVPIIPFQFRQLIHNLLANSLKFSKPELPPHIIIKNDSIRGHEAIGLNLSPEKKYWHISVADIGIGFEPEYKDHIFEVFKRLHDKQKITGTGIGLAIVKKIVENHHGVITATGELNKGAIFDIYIPST